MKCFFDIVVNNFPKGRLVFELDKENYPKSSENFAHLCIGDKMNEKGEVLHYKGSKFHCVRDDICLLIGGDFVNGNGTGGASIYGPTFHREPRKSGFDVPGSLAMVTLGEGLNEHTSVFFISGRADNTAFQTSNRIGRVVDGMELLEELATYGDAGGNPSKEIIIGDCNSMP